MRKEMILIIYRLFLISSNKSNFMFNIDDNQESYNRR